MDDGRIGDEKTLDGIAMKHSDFEVGVEFFTATGKWRCTDLGSRTVAAIRLNHPDDPSWYNGPDVEAAWAVEIEKRAAQLDAGSVESIPWEQVRQQVLDQLKAARRR